MKLTEAKLKQLIRESMGQSQHYSKLKTLMTTEEGFNQAQSLFEMIEGTLGPKEATELKRYFETVDLAKELYTLSVQEDEYREKFNKIEAELLKGAPIDAEADKAYSELVRTSNDRYRKRGKFNTKMSVILKHGDRSIFHVVKSMTEKILKGAI
jgi:hypothetical protein